MIFITDNNTAKIMKPCEESFNFPTARVSSQNSPILSGCFLPIRFMRSDKLNIMRFFQLFIKLITIIGLISNKKLWLFINKKTIESVFYQSYFMRRSACDANGDRKTRAVCNCHDLAPFPSLCLANSEPPFLAPAKVPSMKHSVMSIFPRSFKSLANLISICSNTPFCTQNWKRRWHVWYEGYLPGRSFHGAPVRSIHKIPFRISRLSRKGLPFPSGFFLDGGNKGSIIIHCSFVSSIEHNSVAYSIPLPYF